MASCHVRKVNAEDGFFDASTSLTTVSSMVDACDEQERTLHAMDIFAGQANFTKVCSDNGHSCETIDVLSDPENHDILTAVGFYYILSRVLKVVSRLNSAYDLAYQDLSLLSFLLFLLFPNLCMSVGSKNFQLRLSLEPCCWGHRVGSSYLCLAPTTKGAWSFRMATRPRKGCEHQTKSSSTCWFCWQ